MTGSPNEPRDAALAERVRAAEQALHDARVEQARLWDEVMRLRRERQDVAHFRDRVASMEGSVSWKLTEPLRIVKVLWLKLQYRLDRRRRQR